MKSHHTEKVVDLDIADLKEHPDNYIFKASSQFIKNLAASIARDGLEEPILVNREGYIISGHKRVKAWPRNRIRTFPEARSVPSHQNAREKAKHR